MPKWWNERAALSGSYLFAGLEVGDEQLQRGVAEVVRTLSLNVNLKDLGRADR